jgi:hypothetical protein
MDGNMDRCESQNPYINVDRDGDAGQPFLLSGQSMPWHAKPATPPSLVPEILNRVAWRCDADTSSQNPYANAGDVPEPAIPAVKATAFSRVQSRKQIEAKVRDVHAKLWRNRGDLWRGRVPSDPIKMLDPEKALSMFGYRVRRVPGGLGRFQSDGVLVEAAAIIDPKTREVQLSTLPSLAEQAFTLAHELGHVILDSVGQGVHRDRSLNGSSMSRNSDERAADIAAARFLMPENLLMKVFSECFRTERFELNDDTAFALLAKPLSRAERQFPTRRGLSFYLAATEHFDTRGFPSLAARFNVSVGAMAIRLEELRLVA